MVLGGVGPGNASSATLVGVDIPRAVEVAEYVGVVYFN